jgi:hypothetical protein
MTIIRARINPMFPSLVEIFLSDTPDFPLYVNPANPQTDMDRMFLGWLAAGNQVEAPTS